MGDRKRTRTEPRAQTPKAREEQLSALAVDLAEKQLREGTASAQVISFYLRKSSPKEQLEIKKLEEEVAMLKAKTAALESNARMEELYSNAIKAMQLYGGYSNSGDNDE